MDIVTIRSSGDRRKIDRREEDRKMSFKKFGIDWRYDTLIGFAALILACILCTHSLNRRLIINSEVSIQATDALRESLNHSVKSEGDIIKQVTAIEVEQRVLEDKLADRQKSLESLSRLIRKSEKK